MLADFPSFGLKVTTSFTLSASEEASIFSPRGVGRSVRVTVPGLFRPSRRVCTSAIFVTWAEAPVATVGSGSIALTTPGLLIVTPSRQVRLAVTYFGVEATVKALLGSDACAIAHVIGAKKAGVAALAGVTVNDPAAARVVVKAATTEPGMTAVDVIQDPVERAGRLWLENVPSVPPTTTFVTVALGAPNANPYCGADPDGTVIVKVYEVPLPAAVQVSPDA